MVAARGETIGLQFAFRSSSAEMDLRLDAGTPTGPRGATLPAPRVRWIDCVEVKHATFTFADAVPDVERPSPGLFPDPLHERESSRLTPGRTLSAHLSCTVPADALPGIYTGSLRVMAADWSGEETYEMEILSSRISEATHLNLTNWQMEPSFQARYFGYDLGSPRFWRYVENIARDMVAHRSRVFMVHPYDLVRGVQQREGTIEWDFTLLDRYVEIFLRAGAALIEGEHVFVRISRDLSLVGMQTRRELRIRNEDGDSYHRPSPLHPERPVLGGEVAEKRLGSFLTALYRHLGEQGWLERYVQHVMDEPGTEYAEAYREARSFVRRHMPGVSTVDASHTMDLGLDLTDRYVPMLHTWDEGFRQRQRDGARDWWYTCCAPRDSGYPNRFLDYPLLDARILFWLSFAEGVDGFLHWGYNRYFDNLHAVPEPRDPYLHPGVGFTPPGDAHVVYPGPDDRVISSLRWEQTLEGQQDYEHLRRLEELDPTSRTEGGLLNQALRACCSSLTGYTRDLGVLLQWRERVLREIERRE